MTAESAEANPNSNGPSAGDDAAERARRVLKEGLSAAERLFADAAGTADRLIRDGIETLRTGTGGYPRPAAETFDDAQRYLVERIKERPVTAAFAGLGIGVLLGVLLSNRGK